MRGFFVGRFQPFHEGHLEFVSEIADRVDEVIVGIGSADASHTEENPFTAGERISMIHRTLKAIDATTFAIPLQDVDRNAVWVAHVTSMCPSFDVVYTNNPLVERLFSEEGYDVRGVRLVQRDRYRGTHIRRLMCEREEWRHLVPEEVAAVIDEVDGVDRLLSVHRDDEG